MRKSFLAVCTVLLSILIVVSCKTIQPTPPPQEDVITSEIITLEGEFRSTKGVMTSLSCYCYNSGVLKQADESTIDICFEENVEVPCSNIRVTGRYATEYKQVDENHPCASGSMEFFKVVSFTCVEE